MLKEAGLWDAYIARPPYQRNDYLGCIRSGKLPGTAQKRTQQMLEELRKGDTYMKMRWKPR